MLTLYRHEGESIFIGKDDAIKITLLKNRGKSCKIGILAPSHIPIRREELEPFSKSTNSFLQRFLKKFGITSTREMK